MLYSDYSLIRKRTSIQVKSGGKIFPRCFHTGTSNSFSLLALCYHPLIPVVLLHSQKKKEKKEKEKGVKILRSCHVNFCGSFRVVMLWLGWFYFPTLLIYLFIKEERISNIHFFSFFCSFRIIILSLVLLLCSTYKKKKKKKKNARCFQLLTFIRTYRGKYPSSAKSRDKKQTS